MIYYGDAGQYVKETPSVFRKILFEKNHIFLPCTELIKDKRPSNIYLVGSGSSYYSAQLAAPFLKKFLGIPVVAVSPINFMENRILSRHLYVEFLSKEPVQGLFGQLIMRKREDVRF